MVSFDSFLTLRGLTAEDGEAFLKLIFRANEKFLPPELLWPILENLLQSLENNDLEKSLNLLSELVPEWERSEINSK